jgi:hypothetical protein
VSKYTEETVLIIAGLADKGITIRLAAEVMGIPLGSVSTLATKHGIRFKAKKGAMRVDNPVRPYREKVVASNIDTLSISLMSRKW